MNYCHVAIGGRLTHDPDLRTTKGGTEVCNIRVAWNRRVKRDGEWEDEPVFISGTIWGARGAAFARNFQRGDPVFLDGELELNQWEDREGRKRQDLNLRVNEWQFQAGKKRESQPAATEDDDTAF